MHTKSTILNGELEEECCIEQPEGFPLTKEKAMLCRLKKELYDLSQAPQTWYAILDQYMSKLGFDKGMKNNKL